MSDPKTIYGDPDCPDCGGTAPICELCNARAREKRHREIIQRSALVHVAGDDAPPFVVDAANPGARIRVPVGVGASAVLGVPEPGRPTILVRAQKKHEIRYAKYNPHSDALGWVLCYALPVLVYEDKPTQLARNPEAIIIETTRFEAAVAVFDILVSFSQRQLPAVDHWAAAKATLQNVDPFAYARQFGRVTH